jgi:integrase
VRHAVQASSEPDLVRVKVVPSRRRLADRSVVSLKLRGIPADVVRRLKGKRHSKAFRGILTEARTELRQILRSADTGEHVTPDKMTVDQWIGNWIAAGAPGRRKKVSARTLEGYEEKLRNHVVPTLGKRPLQQLQATEIDKLYSELDGKVSPTTAHHIHTIFNACVGAAVRKRLMPANPIMGARRFHRPTRATTESRSTRMTSAR